MKLVGYMRVSNKEACPSFEEQERRIRAYCRAYSYKLIRLYRETTRNDSKISHLHLGKVLKAVDKADGIISMRLDRLYCSTLDVLRFVELTLRPKNKDLILLEPNIDTSGPYGLFALTAIGAMNQLEHDKEMAVQVGKAVGTYKR